MVRKWFRRGMAALVLALLVGGWWASSNWNALQARYAARQLASAASDEERIKWADNLAARGEPGTDRLLEFLRSGEPAVSIASAEALDRHLTALPENDPGASHLCGRLLELFEGSDAATCESLVVRIPSMLTRGGTVHAARTKHAVAAALKMPSAAARLAAIRAAMHPQIACRGEIVPLLSAAEPEVRRAALFAVGLATEAEAVVIGDEDLFHWLHDPDGGVRTLCREALVSRGRSEVEIGLGRRLVDPDAGERLKLLLDLRYDDDVADPEPWLERLSHDVDPGVRAGAVRVMMELILDRRTPPPAWVGKLAEADSDFTVRRIARFYRALPEAKPDLGVRLIDGP